MFFKQHIPLVTSDTWDKGDFSFAFLKSLQWPCDTS